MDNPEVTCYIDPYTEELIKLPIGFPIPNKDDVVSINDKRFIIVKRRMNFHNKKLIMYLDATRYYG